MTISQTNDRINSTVKIWEVSLGKQLLSFPTSSVVAAVSPDWKNILLTSGSGNIAHILKLPNFTQELIDAATKSIPEGLNIEDWKKTIDEE